MHAWYVLGDQLPASGDQKLRLHFSHYNSCSMDFHLKLLSAVKITGTPIVCMSLLSEYTFAVTEIICRSKAFKDVVALLHCYFDTSLVFYKVCKRSVSLLQ